MKIHKMQVMLFEFEFGMLQIWKFILNDPSRLSPPILIHISSEGITPLCQVS